VPAGKRLAMIALLARFFRGLHMIVGMTAPPPGKNERIFVLVWLGMILFVMVFCTLLFFFIAKMYTF
jgi:hypothetical protein